MTRLDPDDITDRLSKMADEVLRDGRIPDWQGLLLFERLRDLRDDIVAAIEARSRRADMKSVELGHRAEIERLPV